jgi:hypothetical protein
MTESRIILVNCENPSDFSFAAIVVDYALNEMPGKEAFLLRNEDNEDGQRVFVRKNKNSVLVRFEDKGSAGA